MGVGCEKHEKIWTVVWCSNWQGEQRGLGDQFYTVTIRIEGATERRSKL